MAEIHVPELSLVVLIGVSGSGKSSFAREKFGPYEAVSSDTCRALVCGDENDQSASADAFELLHHLVGTRLRRGLLTVVDATSTRKEARADLVRVAREHDVLPVAIVLDVDPSVAIERNRHRPERDFGEGPVRRQHRQLKSSLRALQREGFRQVTVLSSEQEIAGARIVRDRLLNDRTDLHGPFDVVGDVHGCLDELLDLLDVLGYVITRDERGGPSTRPTPTGAPWCCSATWSTGDRTRWASCAWPWA
ncbi:AAA family ATPase [Arsenicicoccus dermatophilus]|uniref:AAA family ATPase n=1 Tax=Arsenicicoccus dermatophilus TaxID=1076331 RepID=UPI0030C67BF8